MSTKNIRKNIQKICRDLNSRFDIDELREYAIQLGYPRTNIGGKDLLCDYLATVLELDIGRSPGNHFTDFEVNELTKLLDTYPDQEWDWDYLSENPNITLDMVLAHPDKQWSWYRVSKNPNITLEEVLAHQDKEWDWEYLSRNPNIPLQYIMENPNKKWDWEYLSERPDLTFDMVARYPNKKWNFKYLSKHLPFDQIYNSYPFRVDWECLAQNPSITFEDISENMQDDWNWSSLSKNKFQKHKQIHHYGQNIKSALKRK